MTLDTFRIRRVVDELVLAAMRHLGASISDVSELSDRGVRFGVHDLLIIGRNRSGSGPEHRELSPAEVVAWLVYYIGVATRADERPAGFHQHSLLANVIAGGFLFSERVMLHIHLLAWSGPLSFPESIVALRALHPAKAYDELLQLTDEIERLANDAVPAVRALQRVHAGDPHSIPEWQALQRVSGPGREISSVWSWFAGAPPKGGERQWKHRHSAKELALAWCRGNRVQMPGAVGQLLGSNKHTAGFVPMDVLPEHVTPLDDFRGETRNHDLIAVGPAASGHTLLAVEAKVTEPLGPRLDEQLAAAATKPTSKVPDRLALLCTALFGEPFDPTRLIDDAEVRRLRYQLLTASCGAVIEAGRRGCDQAILLIHRFAELSVDGTFAIDPADTLDTDFERFLRALDWQVPTGEATLAGPFILHPSWHVPQNPRLFLATITTPFADQLPPD